jgi:hypothetical protein
MSQFDKYQLKHFEINLFIMMMGQIDKCHNLSFFYFTNFVGKKNHDL